MPKSNAPFEAPLGKKWCSAHDNRRGAYLGVSAFPNEKYSYCRDCKRAYQRVWDKTKRKRPERIQVPAARLSKDETKVIIHLPNTEMGRNATRELFTRWPDVDLDW